MPWRTCSYLMIMVSITKGSVNKTKKMKSNNGWLVRRMCKVTPNGKTRWTYKWFTLLVVAKYFLLLDPKSVDVAKGTFIVDLIWLQLKSQKFVFFTLGFCPAPLCPLQFPQENIGGYMFLLNVILSLYTNIKLNLKK